MQIRERKRKRPLINITSLIDVMFLLLVFFMVSTTFAEHPAIKLELPSASTAEPSRLESLTLTIDKKGRMFLNGEAVNDGELRSLLAAAPCSQGRQGRSLWLRHTSDGYLAPKRRAPHCLPDGNTAARRIGPAF